jgi:hypothetical protein
MTREPQATMKIRQFRAADNTLFFNNLKKHELNESAAWLEVESGFAQARLVLLSKQHVAITENRPATRPGAD